MKHTKAEPRLIDYMGAKRCSICKMPFPPGAEPALSIAFPDHVRMAHRPGQTSEDVNQAAARIVRDTTE